MDENKLKLWIVKILPSEESEEAVGTGFWAAEGGYVLTCTHVLENSNPPWVAYRSQKAPAKIVERFGDISLLHVPNLDGEVAPLDSEFKRDDIIDSIGYQYENRLDGVGYFPMKGIVSGSTIIEEMEAIALEDAIHVKPGASGAPALNRRTGKVVGIISHKWEKQQIAFVLSLGPFLKQCKILTQRFQQASYLQEDIFDYYTNFVGREEVIGVTKEFLHGEGGDYLLIQGKAGIGKTALMVELARKVAEKKFSKEVTCIVFFIRQEGGRNTPEKFLDIMNQQLLQLLGESEEIAISLPEKKRQYQKLMNKVKKQASPENCLLILVDGLDEAAQAGEQPLLEFLPPKAAPFTYWIISSRPLPDVLTVVPTTHFLRRAHSYWLSGLEATEVRELLKQSGDVIERSDTFIEILLKHTNGEPLFLQFLCQDIAIWGARAETHLQEIPHEVNEYFQRQFKLLRERTKETQQPEIAIEILKVLAVAYGGLTPEELAGILNVSLISIRENLEVIERFLLGKERYELMHLEFRRTVEETLMREKDRYRIKEQLLKYCAENWDKDQIKETYALRFYLQHLWNLQQYSEMFRLCTAGYLEKKLGRFISPELLVEDYRLLFEACKATGDLHAFLYWGRSRARISDEVLALRDISGLTHLMGKLSQSDKKWWERGVGLCALIPGTEGKLRGLLGMCKGLDPRTSDLPENAFRRIEVLLGELLERRGLKYDAHKLQIEYMTELCRWGEECLPKAWQVFDQIKDNIGAVQVLIKYYVDFAQSHDGLNRVLQSAERLTHEYSRYQALLAISKGETQLGAIEKARTTLAQSLQSVHNLDSANSRFKELVKIAKGYRELGDIKMARKVLDQARKNVTQLKYMGEFVYSLGELAQGYGQLQDLRQAKSGLKWIFIIANSIEDDSFRSQVLIKLINGYEELENAKQSKKLVLKVLHESNKIKDEDARCKALSSLARIYAKLGDVNSAIQILAQALESAENAEDKCSKDALITVAEGYIQIPNEQQALIGVQNVIQVALKIAPKTFKPNEFLWLAISSLAKSLSHLKEIQNILIALNWIVESTKEITLDIYRAWALKDICQQYGKLGKYKYAADGLHKILQIAQQMESLSSRCSIFSAMAEAYAMLGQGEEAEVSLLKALETAVRIEGDDWNKTPKLSGDGYELLSKVSKFKCDIDQVFQVFAQINDERLRSKLLSEVAHGYMQIGDYKSSLFFLDHARRAANQITNEYSRAEPFIQVTKYYAQLEKTEQRSDGMNQVLQAATSLEEDEKRHFDVLFTIAQECLRLNKIDITIQALTQAAQIAIQHPTGRLDEWFKANSLAKVALLMIDLEIYTSTNHALNQVFVSLTHLEFINTYSGALSSIALGCAKLGDKTRSFENLNRILRLALEIQNEKSRTEVLAALAEAFSQQGDLKNAEQIMYEALETIKKIEKKDSHFEALVNVARGLAKLNNQQKAMELLDQILQIVGQYGPDDAILHMIDQKLTPVCKVYNILLEEDEVDKRLHEIITIAGRNIKQVNAVHPVLSEVAQRYGRFKDETKADHGLQRLVKLVEETEMKIVGWQVLVPVAKAYTQFGRVDETTKILNEVILEHFRPETLLEVIKVFASIDKIEEGISSLGRINDGKYFLEASKALLEPIENVVEKVGKEIFTKVFYQILPIAAQHGSRIYLEVLTQAIAGMARFYSPKETAILLAFIENELDIEKELSVNIKQNEPVPVLLLKNVVIFPEQSLRLEISDQNSVNLIKDVSESGNLMMIVSSNEKIGNSRIEKGSCDNLNKIGTLARISIKPNQLADDKHEVYIEGITRAKILKFIQNDHYLMATFQVIEDELIVKDFEKIIKNLCGLCQEIVDITTFLPAGYSKQVLSPALLKRIKIFTNPGRLTDFIAENLNLPFEDKQKILELIGIPLRCKYVSEILKKELERLKTDEAVIIEIQKSIRRVQETYYLREYVKAIQD